MSVRRDPKTGRWYFRTIVHKADGTKERLYGAPGYPGPYHALPRSKVGTQEAERRAISEAMTGKPFAGAAVATQEAPNTKTIREHADRFSEIYMPEGKPSAKRAQASALKRILPALGDLTPEALKQSDVDLFAADELKRGRKKKTVNNYLSVLSSLIKYATGEDTSFRFKLRGKDRSEIHAVDPADVERLLAACKDDRYRVVVLLAAEAGLRAGEIRGLQWTDIKDGQLTVRRALDSHTNRVLTPKHDKVRTVPLSPRLTATLAALPRRGLWVVSRLDGGGALCYGVVNVYIGKLYDRAGVARPSDVLHCLRHTFGTAMARRVPLPVLQQLMGHEDVQTTMKYVDVNEADKREAIALVYGAVAGRGTEARSADLTS